MSRKLYPILAGLIAASLPALLASASEGDGREPYWLAERCSVSHEGLYDEARVLRTREYHYFRVRLTNNCRFARMACLVHYDTLVHKPAYAGSGTRRNQPPHWESASITLRLAPRAQDETEALGPARRNAGRYRVECRKDGGDF